MGSEPDGLKDRGQGGDEVFQPGRQIGLVSAEVVVVVRMDGQSPIIEWRIFLMKDPASVEEAQKQGVKIV